MTNRARVISRLVFMIQSFISLGKNLRGKKKPTWFGTVEGAVPSRLTR